MPNSKPDSDFDTVIPELATWDSGRGIDIDEWICCVGNFEHAIGYSRLFWPPFVEHDGAVFFARRFDEEIYRDWMDQTSGDRRAVEAVMNHIHVLNVFGDPALSPTTDQVRYLAGQLREMWIAKLQRDFPSRRFRVEIYEPLGSELLDYQVAFFQVR